MPDGSFHSKRQAPPCNVKYIFLIYLSAQLHTRAPAHTCIDRIHF